MRPVFDRKEIQGILPHRHPFLFVDEVTQIVPGERIVGLARVRTSGTFLARDSGGGLYFPPTLLVEAMAQVGAILVLHPEEKRGQTIYFRAIDQAQFHRRVPAGATVRIEGVVKKMRSRLGSFEMKAHLEVGLAAEALMTFALSG